MGTLAFLWFYLHPKRGIHVIEDVTEPMKATETVLSEITEFFRPRLDPHVAPFYGVHLGGESTLFVVQKQQAGQFEAMETLAEGGALAATQENNLAEYREYMITRLEIPRLHKIGLVRFNMGHDPRFCWNTLDFGASYLDLFADAMESRSDKSIVDLWEDSPTQSPVLEQSPRAGRTGFF